MKATALVPSILIAAAACASPYREAPPETTARPPNVERPASVDDAPTFEPEPAGREIDAPPMVVVDASGQTVIGSVAADGTLHADTLAGARPDTSRVMRETVVTGAVRSTAGVGTLATGYRVQVFAARDRDVAADAVRRLREQRVSDPIYMEWIDPWYKVRVGDFTDRESAEQLRRGLAELGFPEAWIIRTTIRTAP
ncbi:MAG: SPOR domain-containing protein [Gemmatimonadetes bacterium]|nr:SPOR domain-containing protein [Gemmatimonadota bacterium]